MINKNNDIRHLSYQGTGLPGGQSFFVAEIQGLIPESYPLSSCHNLASEKQRDGHGNQESAKLIVRAQLVITKNTISVCFCLIPSYTRDYLIAALLSRLDGTFNRGLFWLYRYRKLYYLIKEKIIHAFHLVGIRSLGLN